jgi:hypothetical protein
LFAVQRPLGQLLAPRTSEICYNIWLRGVDCRFTQEASNMPLRFGTKSLLTVVTLVALWLSTFAGYSAGADVRASILLLIFVGSGVAALCYRGKRRAFWGSFFGVMLLCGGNDFSRPLHRYAPSFMWPSLSAYATPPLYAPMPVAASPYTPPTANSIDISFDATPVAVAPLPPTSVRQILQRAAFDSTLAAVWTFGLAMLAGLIGVVIYNQSRPAAE